MPEATLSIPVPDALREVYCLRELLEERLAGMDKAIELVAQSYNKVPTAAQIDIANLRELQNEKFLSLNNRFNEFDKRAERQETEYSANIKTAFDAASQAISKTENAVAKTEAFLVKQIDQLFAVTQITANRVQVLESSKAGAKEIKSDAATSHTMLIAAIGVATAIMVAVVAWNHATPPQAPLYSAPIPTMPVQPAPK